MLNKEKQPQSSNLSNQLIRSINLPNLEIPNYNRNSLIPSIVHIGAGGFHRSHQAFFLDKLASSELSDKSWGIIASGIREQDRFLRDTLRAQDYLYTVVERSGLQNNARIIGVLCDYKLGSEDPNALINCIADSQTKIVSLTITGAGYYLNQSTQRLNLEHKDILHDLQHQETPVTIFGYLARGLKIRMEHRIAPCTIMSCDNFQGNGNIMRDTLLDFCEHSNKELAGWITDNVAFPNSVVDRITPVPNEHTSSFVYQQFGINDGGALICEPFIQWIIEDKFSNGRPALERVGVQFTRDVRPYEKIKLRLLNAGHSLIAYLGYLAGYRYIHEIVEDPIFAQFLFAFMDEEVTPILEVVSGIDLDNYKTTLIRRFANHSIKDEALRICMKGSYKIPKFILPTIREQITNGGSIEKAALAVASWMRFLQGIDEAGNKILIEDPIAEELQKRAIYGKEDPSSLLEMHQIFGDLANNSSFKSLLQKYLRNLYSIGAIQTIQACL